MPGTIRVLIAEDHQVVREGLKILIQCDPELTIAGETGDGLSAVRMARQIRPDVVLMDIALPSKDGLEATSEICKHLPNTAVLVLSAYEDGDTVNRALAAGASGYISKFSAANELINAVHQVFKGQHPVVRRPHLNGTNGKIPNVSPIRFRVPNQNLSPRESEVVSMIAQGDSSKDIAFHLGISIKTVQKHRQAAMDKLGVHDVAGLTRFAWAKGLVFRYL